jgi:hypothetical protein
MCFTLQPRLSRGNHKMSAHGLPIPRTNPIPSAVASRQPPPQSSNLPPKEDSYDIILQPETRPISQEQLVAEVKGIYVGLVMVEAECIEVDNKQATSQRHLRWSSNGRGQMYRGRQ